MHATSFLLDDPAIQPRHSPIARFDTRPKLQITLRFRAFSHHPLCPRGTSCSSTSTWFLSHIACSHGPHSPVAFSARRLIAWPSKRIPGGSVGYVVERNPK